MSHSSSNSGTIYLKYHPSDIEFAMTLVDILESKGFTLWARDRHALAGKRLDRQLEVILEETRLVLFILSRASVADKDLVEELLILQGEGKKLLPLQIEPCELPRKLQRIQFIDLHSNKASGVSRLLKEMAMSGHWFSGLDDEVLSVLTEREQKLLAKKETAKQEMNRIEAKRRSTKNFLTLLGIVVLGALAVLTFDFVGQDRYDFDRMYETYKLNHIRDKDTLELVQEEFYLHLEKFQFCGHREGISRLLREYEFRLEEDATDVKALVRENDSLRAVIGRMRQE